MASIIERIRNIVGRKPQIETSRGLESFAIGADGYGYWNPELAHYRQDRIFRVMDNCGIKYDQNNPYEQLRVSRFMYEVFPFAKKALNDISSMVGNVKIGLKEANPDPDLIKELNDLACQMPILSEFDWENGHEFGFNNFVYRMAFSMLRDGMAFKESRYRDNVLNPDNYLGCLVFDSVNFHYRKTDPNKPWSLIYKSDQEAMRTGYFDYVGYDFKNTHPWASPLLAGGSFFVEVLIATFVAIKNVNLRKGNPLEMYMVGLKDDTVLQNAETRKAYIAAQKTLEKSMLQGAKNQKEGKGGIVVGKIPAQIEFLSKAFGTDAIQDIDPNVLELIFISISNLLGVPLEYLGIVLGGAGFSPERFRIMWKIFGSLIDNIRTKLEPLALFEVQNFYRSIGYDPSIIERLTIEFEDPDIQDEKEKAETSKLNAEAAFKHMEVAEKMHIAGIGLDVIEWYLRNNDLIEEGMNLDMQFAEPVDQFEQQPGREDEPEKELIAI